MTVTDGIPIDLSFPAEYDVTTPGEIPGRATTVYEFSRVGRIVDGGVLIEVLCGTGPTWWGLVANGFETVTAAKSGVYSTPSPTILCVVARGDAYLINVEKPEHWDAVHDGPVVGIRPVVEARRLVLATSQRLLALDDQGIAWRTARIAIDGIELGEAHDGWIEGIADPRGIESRGFRVNLTTGEHHGGFVFQPPS